MYGILEDGQLIAKFSTPLSVTSNRPVIGSDTLSLKRFSVVKTAQRWEIETNVEPLSTTANKLFSMLVKKGSHESIQIKMPQNSGVISKRTSKSTPVVNGSKFSTQVEITGNSGIIPEGCFIRFSNHSKIYMVTEDMNNSGTLKIFPPLRADLVNVTMAHRDDVLLNCYFDFDVIKGMTYSDGVLMDIGSIRLLEQL